MARPPPYPFDQVSVHRAPWPLVTPHSFAPRSCPPYHRSVLARSRGCAPRWRIAPCHHRQGAAAWPWPCVTAPQGTAWPQPRCHPSRIFLSHPPSLFPGARDTSASHLFSRLLAPMKYCLSGYTFTLARTLPATFLQAFLPTMYPHDMCSVLPQERGVCCLCHLALPIRFCRRFHLARSHLARLHLACISPGQARYYAAQ